MTPSPPSPSPRSVRFGTSLSTGYPPCPRPSTDNIRLWCRCTPVPAQKPRTLYTPVPHHRSLCWASSATSGTAAAACMAVHGPSLHSRPVFAGYCSSLRCCSGWWTRGSCSRGHQVSHREWGLRRYRPCSSAHPAALGIGAHATHLHVLAWPDTRRWEGRFQFGRIAGDFNIPLATYVPGRCCPPPPLTT